jgi:hypothetical protein
LTSRRRREGSPHGSVRQRLAAGTSVTLMLPLLAPITAASCRSTARHIIQTV